MIQKLRYVFTKNSFLFSQKIKVGTVLVKNVKLTKQGLPYKKDQLLAINLAASRLR
jgi:hypothetical protein